MMPPPSVHCHSILADGTLLTVTATRRPRANRADVKCSAPGVPALADRMQQVVRLARHTETRYDSRDQVVISMDRAPGIHERDWELAVVLADRMVRGVLQRPGSVCANGWSDEWHLGRIGGHDLEHAPAHVLLGGSPALPHLGAFAGQPDACASVSSARAWFPLHSGGINDSLCWVEVSVYPFAADGQTEDELVAVPGLELTRQLAVRQALAGARHYDGRGLGRWRTTVRFGQDRFHGDSFAFALVMADRIARGREFLPRGRIIATGASSAWHAGRIEAVEGVAPKCALMLREAAAGDRVLLPKAWQSEVAAGYADDLRAKGASIAFVDRIGII